MYEWESIPDFDRQEALYFNNEMMLRWFKENWNSIPKIQRPYVGQMVQNVELDWCCISKVLRGGRRVAVFTIEKSQRVDKEPKPISSYRKTENITIAWSNHVYPESPKKYV
jgi:uncharacterized protein (DUF2461 family)